MAEEMKRVRRSKEERIAEIENKIEYHKKMVAELEQKKENILNPQPKKTRLGVASVLKMAKEKGMSPDEMIKKLGLDE